MGVSQYTEEEKRLAVQYYFAAKIGIARCAEELGLQEYDIANWMCRMGKDVEESCEVLSPEDLKAAFLTSVNKRIFKERTKKSRARFYRPTSSSLVWRR